MSLAAQQDLIVKVISQPCGAPEKSLFGSGIIFSQNGKNYVLTSEHVVYQEKRGFCFSVENSEFGVLRANLISADWTMGLALLEVQSDLPYIPQSLKQQTAQLNPSDNENVVTAGFPVTSKQILIDARGTVLRSQSLRHVIVGVPTTIETINSHVEYGMSGGALLNQNSKLVGILSHQVLEMKPGQSTGVADITPQSQFENHALAIPMSEVSKWANDVLKGSARNNNLTRDAGAQLSGQEILRGFGMKFDLKKATPLGTKMNGGDGVGIGGADNAGTASISIEAQDLSAIAGGSENMTMIERAVKKYRKIIVPFFVEVNLDEQRVQKRTFTNQGEFFRLLNKSDVKPILIVSEGRSSDDPAKTVTTALAQDIQAMSQRLSEVDKLFLNKLKFISELCEKGNGYLIPNDIFRKLLSEEDSWSVLFNADFDLAVSINSQIRTMQEKLKTERF
jgi:S1-C subfamily serine protease